MRRVTAAVGSAVFFLVGPGIVVGLIPWLLTGWQVREPVPYWAPMRVLGAILLLAGLIVLIQAFVRFVVEGLGTPAPIAAPERLVVGGLYRYVRNPMYVAILAVLVGQALLLRQLALLLVPHLPAGGGETPPPPAGFGGAYGPARPGVPPGGPRLRPWEPGERDEPGAR